MANALKRVGIYLGLMDEAEVDSPQNLTQPAHSDVRVRVRERESGQSGPRGVVVDVAPRLDLPILDRIITLHPRFYNEARSIGEHYRAGNPVIINLTEMDELEHKRLVDFASGLAFGLNGTIERVAKRVFLISPANVLVSSDDKSAAAQASFFNQS